MKVFGVLAGKGSKRVEAVYVTCQLLKTYFTCQLFKTYFKLGTVNPCRSVIRSIETARIFDFEEFPRRDKSSTAYQDNLLEPIRCYIYWSRRSCISCNLLNCIFSHTAAVHNAIVHSLRSANGTDEPNFVVFDLTEAKPREFGDNGSGRR
ncbi:uncharacterized protein LOC112089659 [Eutrema salsugineum]|uniref:uncharacterized protein LOC112089659 n=1 Tax=Eutrema salsugineum TaxID=72664 RepID=UPI000CED57A0|nr:uncharacterized protein LOC112089659 [Eutrema salsugineum]